MGKAILNFSPLYEVNYLKEYFEGSYYKHQKGDVTLSIIVGKSTSEEFIQIITNDCSYVVPFIGSNQFSKNGIKLDIHTSEISLVGSLHYVNLSPIKYDIMGSFRYFPMECKHGIISMYHKIRGSVVLNGQTLDFTNGIGYIEKDFGTSFPSSYVWVQSNDFIEKCSIMVSIAHIPFYGFHFRGCICVIHYEGKEYRLATYLGVRVLSCSPRHILLKQGKYKLSILLTPSEGHLLKAPQNGKMSRKITERAACPARFFFAKQDQLLFDFSSNNTSYEYED